MRRSKLFASPMALGKLTPVAPSPLRVHVLPEGRFGIGGVVRMEHTEERDGKTVRVIDEFEAREISILLPPSLA